MVQWLGLHASTAEATGSIPGPGTKTPQAIGCGQKKTEKKSEWKWGVSANRYRVSFQDDENVLELDSGGGCMTF